LTVLADAHRFDVSVVIPLYSKAAFITSTLETVLGQSLKPREIIVIDDGSTDQSAAIVADYAKQHPMAGIRLIYQSNAGPGPARNRGIAEGQGEWIAFIDGDDRWAENHLESLAEVVAALPEAAVVTGTHRRLFASEEIPPQDTARRLIDQLDFFRVEDEGKNLWTSAVAVKRSVLQSVGGFAAFFPGEDVDLWFRLALEYSLGRSDRCTSFYTQQTGGIMEAGEHTKAATFDGWPLGQSIDRALADPRYRSKHSQIAALKLRFMMNSVKQELYCGNAARARMIIRECMPPGVAVPKAYRIIALLPARMLGPTVRLAARVRNLVTRPLRQR
jgi:glycosyltransferase involved in cell wall biosynthesis